jgi:hypothetical protein
MDESTYLSRAFSDQGVRLRLRKEPRAMMGSVFLHLSNRAILLTNNDTGLAQRDPIHMVQEILLA